MSFRKEKYVDAYKGISKNTMLMTGTFQYSRHPRSGSEALTAIAAQQGCNSYETDTKQASLYGDMDNDGQVCVRAPGLNQSRRVVCFGSRKLSTGRSKRLDDGTRKYQLGGG